MASAYPPSQALRLLDHGAPQGLVRQNGTCYWFSFLREFLTRRSHLQLNGGMHGVAGYTVRKMRHEESGH